MDEEKKVSRQRRYQLRHKVVGLCIICPKQATNNTYCLLHYKKNQECIKLRHKQRLRKDSEFRKFTNEYQTQRRIRKQLSEL
ncbi:MAG: hypothetical protein PHE73_09190 [Sulfurovaceae bacterium]|nr:hypothetical protein [Sulfurovaceae bacterium]